MNFSLAPRSPTFQLRPIGQSLTRVCQLLSWASDATPSIRQDFDFAKMITPTAAMRKGFAEPHWLLKAHALPNPHALAVIIENPNVTM